MATKSMKILIIEDDRNDCNNIYENTNNRRR